MRLTPDVDVRRVFPDPEEQFRSPVPEGDHDGGVWLQRRAVLPGEAKISDLQNPVVAEEQVGSLDVPEIQYKKSWICLQMAARWVKTVSIK